MAYDFAWDAAVSALRGVVKTAYAIPASRAIPEAGNPPVAVTRAKLPMAALEAGGECGIADLTAGGQFARSARSIEEVQEYYCWLLMPTTQGANDLAAMRAKLAALAKALVADRRLGNTVTVLELVSIDWSGKGRDWPFEIQDGIGVQAGYVGVKLVIQDV